MTLKDKNCQTIVDLLSDYVDGELGRKDRKFIDKHIEKCSKCEEFISEFQKSVNWTSACFQKEIQIPEPVLERLEKYIERLEKDEINNS